MKKEEIIDFLKSNEIIIKEFIEETFIKVENFRIVKNKIKFVCDCPTFDIDNEFYSFFTETFDYDLLSYSIGINLITKDKYLGQRENIIFKINFI